jgi:prepilin-type N-terminal cleavage/methylation domain-containing protein
MLRGCCRSGFTLFELLVVIFILAILTAVMLNTALKIIETVYPVQELKDPVITIEGPMTSVISSEPLPMLSSEQAWRRLPGAPATSEALPYWARVLAGPLPITTARMLELDALHRAGNQLSPRLRGLIRYAAATANQCNYSQAVASADWCRAGKKEDELRVSVDDPSRLNAAEQAAVVFAQKMMNAAYTIPDEEVKQLLEYIGEEQFVALVALLAHASFQDRILLAAQTVVEPDGPLPPVMAHFARPEPDSSAVHVSAAPGEKRAPAEESNSTAANEWLTLQEGLDQQRARVGRIRVPSREEMLKRIGADHHAVWQAGILWSRVCYGNQPELTDAWFACVSAFRQETHQDRILQQCIFWISTQAQRCFY